MFLRNMYPFERFMGILKRFCRNRNHPKARILQGYTVEEVVEFCTEYMKQRPIGFPLSSHKGRLKGKLVLAGTQMAAPGQSLMLKNTWRRYAKDSYQWCLQQMWRWRSTLRTTPNGWRIVWHKDPSMTLLRGWHKSHHLRCWHTKHMT